jgi:hypothetical protein
MCRMETKQIRIRVSPDDWELLSEIAAGHATNQSIAGIVLAAACQAIRENGGKLTLPLHLSVGIHEPRTLRLNEPASYKKK